MEFTSGQIKMAKRLSYGANLFQRYFFRDPLFREQFEANYKALVCFVENYAYQRQGAPASSYSKIAKKAIENRFNGSMNRLLLQMLKKHGNTTRKLRKKSIII